MWNWKHDISCLTLACKVKVKARRVHQPAVSTVTVGSTHYRHRHCCRAGPVALPPLSGQGRPSPPPSGCVVARQSWDYFGKTGGRLTPAGLWIRTSGHTRSCPTQATCSYVCEWTREIYLYLNSFVKLKCILLVLNRMAGHFPCYVFIIFCLFGEYFTF